MLKVYRSWPQAIKGWEPLVHTINNLIAYFWPFFKVSICLLFLFLTKQPPCFKKCFKLPFRLLQCINSLKSPKNVVFFSFCILVDMTMGGLQPPSLPLATLLNEIMQELSFQLWKVWLTNSILQKLFTAIWFQLRAQLPMYFRLCVKTFGKCERKWKTRSAKPEFLETTSIQCMKWQIAPRNTLNYILFSYLILVFGLDSLRQELKSLKERRKFVTLSYNTTFNLGDYFLSVLLLRPGALKENPIIPLALLLHQKIITIKNVKPPFSHSEKVIFK